MKKNKKTDLTRFLVKLGCSQRNAYRIVNESNGKAAQILVSILPEYMALKKASDPKP